MELFILTRIEACVEYKTYLQIVTFDEILILGGIRFLFSKFWTIISEQTVRKSQILFIVPSYSPCFDLIINFDSILDNLKNGKFHQHLRDIFAPQVVRYVDLMESSISQSIYKGFEKEKWEIKG